VFIERLINQTNAPLVEQVLKFSAARHKLIAGNMANVDTPGYRQKDLSQAKFYALLKDRAQLRNESGPGSVGFDGVEVDMSHPSAGILFHDGNNRSMEQLSAEQAKNGMLYTMAIELLKKQYSQMEMALRERVS